VFDSVDVEVFGVCEWSGLLRTGDRVVWWRVGGCLLVPCRRRPLKTSLRGYLRAEGSEAPAVAGHRVGSTTLSRTAGRSHQVDVLW